MSLGQGAAGQRHEGVGIDGGSGMHSEQGENPLPFRGAVLVGQVNAARIERSPVVRCSNRS